MLISNERLHSAECILWLCEYNKELSAFYSGGGSLLTGIILWSHGSLQDLHEGHQPLFLLPRLLTHEDKMPLWRSHRDAPLPFVSPNALGFTFRHRVAFVPCADENDP